VADGKTILVVEDDPGVRELVALYLADEGFPVEEACDGAEAIAALERHQPTPDYYSLMLLDMMLPAVDGLGVLRYLADDGPRLPVVAMSADHERLVRAVAAGADATIAKPFDLDRLLGVIARWSLRS